MNVLVIGSGGREHALAWKLAQSPQARQVFIAPGNDGIALEPNIEICAVSPGDQAAVMQLCEAKKIDLVVVGPENALAEGLADFLQAKGINVFGPSAKAAQLEASKAFAKELMARENIPTAEFSVFDDAAKAEAYIDASNWQGWVVKADGLAAGKGVVMCPTKEEAGKTVREFLLDAKMGDAGSSLVVEEELHGREVSAFYVCDGENFVCAGYACDYKRIRDNDEGPNTGGMGSFAPADWLPAGFVEAVEAQVVRRCLDGMKKAGTPFQGCMFVGLMATEAGPKVIEFNCRFGDPETQVIMPMLDEDILPVFMAAAKGELAGLGKTHLSQKKGAAVYLVKAAHGYPGTEGVPVRKGDAVTVDEALLPHEDAGEDVKLFFAGVKKDGERLVTSGGRVLGVTAMAESREAARNKAYAAAERVNFNDAQMRTDIGK